MDNAVRVVRKNAAKQHFLYVQHGIHEYSVDIVSVWDDNLGIHRDILKFTTELSALTNRFYTQAVWAIRDMV
jgi:hypothetical protein